MCQEQTLNENILYMYNDDVLYVLTVLLSIIKEQQLSFRNIQAKGIAPITSVSIHVIVEPSVSVRTV